MSQSKAGAATVISQPQSLTTSSEVVRRLRTLNAETFWWSIPMVEGSARPIVNSALLHHLVKAPNCRPFTAQLMQDCALQPSEPADGAHAFFKPNSALKATCIAIQNNPTLLSAFQFVQVHMKQDPAHDLMHVLRVATHTRQLGAELGVCQTHSMLAALLHDVVNVKKGSLKAAKSSLSSAEVAARFLSGQGVPAAHADDICTAITTHSYSSGLRPTSLLGACLQDADRLDALGAIGVLRVLHVGHRLGATLLDAEDPWAERRPIDDKRYIVDHVVAKLRDLPQTLTTQTAKGIGTARQAFLMNFFDALVAENYMVDPDRWTA